MARANNSQGIATAKRNGWYCRFDQELRERITCEASDPDAKLDLIRGLARVDPGPSTRESILAMREKGSRGGMSVGIQGINV